MAEDAIATLAMLAMVVLPLLEIFVRRVFGVGVPGSGPIVQHLALWAGFLGAAIAAREEAPRAGDNVHTRWRGPPHGSAYAAVAAFGDRLAWGGVLVAEGAGTIGADVPAQSLNGSADCPASRPASSGAPAADGQGGMASIGSPRPSPYAIPWLAGCPAWLGLVIAVIQLSSARRFRDSAAGGAVVLERRRHAGGHLVETYALSVSPTLPAIPLFTLAGFILAEGLRLNGRCKPPRALRWIPGGTAVVCAVLCSFFTAFTGGRV